MIEKTFIALALLGLGYLVGTNLPHTQAQAFANQEQRIVRALEQQADSQRSIAASLKKLERIR